ncbi:MAG: hypothetical protein II922_10395 [Succinimonas sp.]|nr:hypothetical protein [Succinimonas sp.]MEE3421804.1 hypothetical protein [Succinimonas sp.]
MLLWILGAILLAGAVVGLVEVARSVRERAVRGAFKYRIEQARAHKVNVGIFDKYTNKLQELEIKADEISSEVEENIGVWYQI